MPSRLVALARTAVSVSTTVRPSLHSYIIFRMASATASPASKRLKTDAPASSSADVPSIGTHNGPFHADEALAVHMLRRLPRYGASTLIRTRDPALLATCHTVVDVGGEHDAQRHRYDHHQRGFAVTFPGRHTKLSSAGLVWAHFGLEVVRGEMAAAATAAKEEEGDEDSEGGATADAVAETNTDLIWRRVYSSFIEALDAHDNGIGAYDPASLAAASITKKFSDGGFTLGAMVGRLNPAWNEGPPSAEPAAAQAWEDARFETASARIGEEFDRELAYYVRAWLPARSVVAAAFLDRRDHDAAGRVLVLRGRSVPWKEHLFDLEAEEQGEVEMGLDDPQAKVLYVVYPEKPLDPAAKWRVQCVPVAKDSFESRKPLPEAWRGFRDEELDGLSRVHGCVFVHASGFIGGNKTFEGAMEMVRKSLELP